jgi:hypothetical protein
MSHGEKVSAAMVFQGSLHKGRFPFSLRDWKQTDARLVPIHPLSHPEISRLAEYIYISICIQAVEQITDHSIAMNHVSQPEMVVNEKVFVHRQFFKTSTGSFEHSIQQ